MSIFSYKKGVVGEASACRYLCENGYTIIKTNYRCCYGEIDIIAKEIEGVLVFIEVKNYKRKPLVHPLQMLTDKKIDNIVHTANYFIGMNEMGDVDMRFDLLILENGKVLDFYQSFVQ